MRALRLDRSAVAVAAVTAVLLIALAFASGGGQDYGAVGIALTLTTLAVTAVFGRGAAKGWLPREFSGAGVIGLMTMLALFAAASVSWSVVPGDSTFDAGRTIAYTAIVAGAALAAQVLPRRGRELLAGLAIGALVVTLYSIGSRVVPDWYPDWDHFARIRLPFHYWNAVAAVAVFGIVASLWAGSARGLSRGWVVASYPAGGVFVLALGLTQSRGAMLVLAVTVAIWLVLAPRRLRSVAWLGTVLAFGGALVAWSYQQTALSTDVVEMDIRMDTGLQLGLLIIVMCALLAVAGYGIERWRARRGLAPPARRRAGVALLCALAIAPLFALAALAASDRGIGGSLGDAVDGLFATSTQAPANTPQRLTETKSLRGRYWREAIEVWKDHYYKGTGADSYSVSRLPYSQDSVKVGHAHGWVPQTMADLGLAGLLISLALLGTWLLAAGRMLGASLRRPTDWLADARDDRLAEVTIVLIAIAFGLHSLIEWTWYIPGVAIFALVAAGWVAGRSMAVKPPHWRMTAADAAPVGDDAHFDDPWQRYLAENPGYVTPAARYLRSAGIAFVGLAAAWAIYQPTSAANLVKKGQEALADGRPRDALQAGLEARATDGTLDRAYFVVASAQHALSEFASAEKTLEDAASRQPANPEVWLRLADYRLNSLDDPEAAIEALRPVLFVSKHDERALTLLAQAEQKQLERVAEQKLEQQAAGRERRGAGASGTLAPTGATGLSGTLN